MRGRCTGDQLGDVFFYFAPDGQLPKTQLFAAIVTKDYSDEPGAGLDRAGAFRLNISVRGSRVPSRHWPRPARADPTRARPQRPMSSSHTLVCGHLAWAAVINPTERTSTKALELLDSAHRAARARYQCRSAEAAP